MLQQETLTLFPVLDPMELEYSEEGDEPLASDYHYMEQIFCYTVLFERFAGPDCYVSFQRWLRRDAAGREPMLQPDLLVARGVPQRNHRVYDPWQEGKMPDLVAEYLSPTSLKADQVGKLDAYHKLRIPEYWLFNPSGEFAGPRIRGWNLLGREGPEPLLEEADGSFASRVLPIRFMIVDDVLEVLDGRSGAQLTPLHAQQLRIREAEASQRAAEASQRAAEARQHLETEARQNAEAEVACLRAELDRLRRGQDT
jgi:Uma2 family endonuclease